LIRSIVFRRQSLFLAVLAACLVPAVAGLADPPAIGEIRMFAGNFAPAGWAFCNGQSMTIVDNSTLYNLIGTTFGGDGVSTFDLPDLQGRVPVGLGQGAGLQNDISLGQAYGQEQVTLTLAQLPSHSHGQAIAAYSGAADQRMPAPGLVLAQGQARYGMTAYAYSSASADGSLLGLTNAANTTSSMGGNQPFDRMPPFVVINYIMATAGAYPSPGGGATVDPFMGSIELFPLNYSLNGWLPCNGQLLPIASNAALFSLLGTTFGGNGVNNFAMPDLRGRCAVETGSGTLGQPGGAETHTMSILEMPGHVHVLGPLAAAAVVATALSATTGVPGAGVNENGEPIKLYSDHPADTQVQVGNTGNAGGSQPFSELPPSLGMGFYICTAGIYPTP
jgi:microcystin-dependent protein